MKIGIKISLVLLVSIVMVFGCASGGSSQQLSSRARPNFKEAQIFMQQYNYERALFYYLRVLETDPDHVESMKNVADLYFSQAGEEEYEEAREIFEIAHGYYIRTIDTILGIDGWENFNRFDLFKSDSELKIESIFARNFILGREAYQEEDFEESEEIFEFLQRLYPEKYEATQMLAAIANRQGDTDRAIGYFLRILEADPTNTVIVTNLAIEYQQLHDYENAAIYFQMFIDLEPENVTGYTSLAYLRMQMDDFETALTLYEQAMEVEPDNVDIVADAANIAQEAGNQEKVLLYWKRLVDLEKNEENVSYLVSLLLRAQSWQEVLTYSKIWYELNPESKDAVQFIMVSANQIGDTATAREYQEIFNKME